VHIGTHVDAPRHFLNDGRTVEQLPLDVLTGPCYVAQLPDGIEAITAEVLDRTEITSEMKRVLFGTRNSHLWARGESKFQTDFVAITEDGAEWLVERGVQLVGLITCLLHRMATHTHTQCCWSRVSLWRG
jgi:arylformamidase